MRVARSLACLACLAVLAAGACARKLPHPPSDAAPPPPSSASAAAVPGPTVAEDAGTDAAVDAGAAAGPVYPTEGIAPLPPDCRNPQALLGVASYSDLSVLRRIQHALIANPEIEVVAGAPGPHQVRLSWAQYGTKFFAQRPPGSLDRNQYVVMADCGDAATCLDVAAMVRAVLPSRTALPSEKPRLFCDHVPGLGEPPTTLRGPWKLPAAMPDARDRVESCARVGACSVRAGAADGEAVWRACWKAPMKQVSPCAGMEDCAEVAHCFRKIGGP